MNLPKHEDERLERMKTIFGAVEDSIVSGDLTGQDLLYLADVIISKASEQLRVEWPDAYVMVAILYGEIEAATAEEAETQ
jgi:hypothetical protein